MDVIDKIINVLTKPYNFFDGLKKEEGIKEAFIYLAIIAFFGTALGAIFGVLMQSFSTNIFSRIFGLTMPQPETSYEVIAFWAVIGYIIVLGLSFVWAGIIHVWILIFGGKGDYTKTYQMTVYAKTPKYVLGWFPFISYIAWIYDLILLIIGTEKIHDISKLKSILMYIIPVVVIVVFYIVIMITAVSIIKSNPGLVQQAIAAQA